jgi:hypothetical protein
VLKPEGIVLEWAPNFESIVIPKRGNRARNLLLRCRQQTDSSPINLASKMTRVRVLSQVPTRCRPARAAAYVL